MSPLSFSGQTKNELCRAALSRKCCAQAEAYGVLLFCNHFSGREVRIVTESGEFLQRLIQLFRRAFRVEFDVLPGPEERGKRTLSITAPDKLRRICETFGADPAEMVAHHINFAVLEEDHCRLAFFRGAFLAGGAVTDRAKGYLVELATSHYYVSRELTPLLR